MPKTAGSSFKLLLESHFGNRLYKDYGDTPINKPAQQRNADAERAYNLNRHIKKYYFKLTHTECIHGHFLPYKYSYLLRQPGVYFITWLRNPADRMASHYYYWKRNYNEKTTGELHRRVIEENWSFERFCLAPELQNIYTQYLWRFPISHFDFIGITECFEEDVEYFARKYLQIKDLNHIPEINKNPAPKDYFPDKGLLKKVTEFHARDFELYHYALQLRQKRIAHYKSAVL